MSIPEIHPTRPEANGFCFSETLGMTDDQVKRMCNGGMVFLTTFKGHIEGRVGNYSGTLIAKDWDDAVSEAERRGLGEAIEGVLADQISV